MNSFTCSERIAEVIQLIRKEFDAVLAQRLQNKELDENAKEVLMVVSGLLESSQEGNR
jgi:hypothetical protein